MQKDDHLGATARDADTGQSAPQHSSPRAARSADIRTPARDGARPKDGTKGEVRFVDTTVRDGQQSLWATNMRTDMMLPALGHLDRAGFEAIEIHANSFEKKMV